MAGKREKATSTGLTPKQEKFCHVYLATGNASEAYRQSYNVAKDTKEASINRRAKTILDEVKIRSRIDALRKPALEKAQVTQERIINELAAIAFGDMRDVMSWGPDGVILKDSKVLTADAAKQVSEVSETSSGAGGGSMKVKKHDKVKALELLGRHVGMWNDKLELTQKVVVIKDYTGRG